ncbi:VOC family protein [Pelagicoccus sp. SDUM812002]|uniref:VOC family protein n=1 Tax=Pelagicoccus sp. SDUM812002 TaxID=3041266 RepID=UPI00280D68C7|nr:VOC family protein [Pelagicoccus sp. SDUM812002]MDQ8184064.1 VOC family protein [Pelagicoccus sp. SDUM812002]
MIKQLAHVCFFTENAEAMVSFYRDILGFPVAFVMNNSDGGTPFGWYMDCGNDTFVEIFDQVGAVQEWGGEAVELKQAANVHYRHICFETTDIEALRNELVGKGVEVTETKKGIDHSYQAWIKDVDGNAIELMMYTPDSLQFSNRK